MDRERLADLLAAVQGGRCSVDAALERLRDLPYEDLGFAKLDHHRGLRNGFPEVVFAQGKAPEQIVAIAQHLAASGGNVLVTRLDAAAAGELCAALPAFAYHREARVAVLRQHEPPTLADGPVLVVSAGTADLPVAEEAVVTAEIMGNRVERLYDVGVAGIHRLLAERERLWQAAVVIVVAGMEGALPSVVGGLVSCPVVAVPTSVGYGASFHGLAALLGMLNTCAAGVVVVNIDNGFGAAAAATRIVRRRERGRNA